MIESDIRIQRLPSAAKENIASLQNWVDGNACISRKETSFLKADDLLTTANPADDALAIVQSRVEGLFVRFHQAFKKVSESPVATRGQRNNTHNQKTS